MDSAGEIYEEMEKAFIMMGQVMADAVVAEVLEKGYENTPQNRIEMYMNTKEQMEKDIGSTGSLMVRVTFALIDYYIEQDRFQIEMMGG